MEVQVVLTDGTHPCGRVFGPMLEAKHVMQILEGKFFDDLAQKSCELAGILLELCGKAKKGKGYTIAKEILENGKALKKMQQIIKAQGGHYIKSRKMPKLKLGKDVLAKESGIIDKINANSQ